LVYNTGSLVAYYFAGDLSNEVQITLATATLGTFASGGFVAVDNTNMPGWYEIGIPDVALDGGNECAIQLRGAANMVPVNIYIELDAIDYQGTPAVDVTKISGDSTAADNLEAAADGTGYNLGSGQIVAASVTGAVGSVTGAVGSVTGNLGGNVNGNVVGTVASVVGNLGGNVAGNVSGSVGSVTGAVGSVTGSVGSVVGNVGGSTASVAGAVGSVTGNVGGDVSGKVLGGGSGTISGDGVRAASVTGAVGSVTGSVGSVVGAVELDSATALKINRIEAVATGTVTGAGTSTEVFVGPSATLTITVDSSGNRSAVVVT
jgi:hypothetical protein